VIYIHIDFGWTKTNLKRILWHSAVVATAAVLTYLLEELKVANFGDNTALVVGALSFTLKGALEFLRKS
jgi:hypothetical protein